MRKVAIACSLLLYGLFCPLALASPNDDKPTDEQIKNRESFTYFTDRFANNVEPVTSETVVNCIVFYETMLSDLNPSVSFETYYDILGSQVGWVKVRGKKLANGEIIPKGKLAELMELQVRSEEMTLLINKTVSSCRSNEFRAHNAAIAKEQASK